MHAKQSGLALNPRPIKLASAALLLLACALHGSGAQAAQCSVSSSDVAFGVYDPLSGAAISSNGAVTVSCTYTGLDILFGFQVTLDLSTGSSNTYIARTMKRAIEALNYNLYKDPPHAIVFGNGSGGTQDVTLCFPGFFNNCNGNPSTSPVTVPVYGLLPAAQDISAGAYSDTIITTLTF